VDPTVPVQEVVGLYPPRVHVQDQKITTNMTKLHERITPACPGLTPWQVELLCMISEEIAGLTASAAGAVKHHLTDDNDLVLYRLSAGGLHDIIIHPDNKFAVSFIGHKEDNRLDFYDLDCDLRSVVSGFLSS